MSILVSALSVFSLGSLLLCLFFQGPTFSSIRFSLSGFILRFLIQLDWSYPLGDKHEFTCILLHVDIKFNHNHLLMMCSFFSASFSQMQVFIDMCISVWVFGLIPMINRSLFSIKTIQFYYASSGLTLEIKNGDIFSNSFNCLGFFFEAILFIVCLVGWFSLQIWDLLFHGM